MVDGCTTVTAYSFKRRFVAPIRLGLTGQCPMDEFRSPRIAVYPKRQTIRADRKRHARPGEELQLYCGMRTKGCFLIGRARCKSVDRIVLDFTGMVTIDRQSFQDPKLLDDFARADGFANFVDMSNFWKIEHPYVKLFEGVIIKWEPIA